MSSHRLSPTGATTESLRSLDAPGAFLVAYALLALALMGGIGSALFPLAGLVLLLLPAVALSRRPLPVAYTRAWGIASAFFILTMLLAQIFLGHPSHIALGLICVFLLLHRWFNARGLREHLESWCLTALLMMIAALKGEGTILILLQLGWFISTLQLFNLLAVFRANSPGSKPRDPYLAAPRSLKTLPLHLPALFILAIAILFLAPRLKPAAASRSEMGGSLSAAERAAVRAGFSETISFQSLSTIQQTNAVALRIVDPPSVSPSSLRLRVATLDDFNGWEWSRSSQPGREIGSGGGAFMILDFATLPPDLEGAGLEWFQIRLEEFPGQLLPLPERTVMLGGVADDITLELGEDGRALVQQARPPRQYHSWALPNRALSPRPLLVGNVDTFHVKIPSVIHDSTAMLSSLIFQGLEESSDGEKASHAANWLRRRGTYTLELGYLPEGPGAIRAFMVTLEGHCELFATALAMVLRHEGIPSRIVTGFNGAEPTFATFGGQKREWIVPHRNAHAWVEAWTEDKGWFALDPTPSALLSQTPAVTTVAEINSYMQAQGNVLSRLVEGYDYEAQRRLLGQARAEIHGAAASWDQGVLLRTWDRFRRNFGETAIQTVTIFLLVANLGASWLYRRISGGGWLRRRNRRLFGETGRPGVSLLFEEIARSLEKTRQPPSGGITSAQWLREALSERGLGEEDRRRFVELYTAWRFNGMDERMESELRELLGKVADRSSGSPLTEPAPKRSSSGH